jgi:hypothetical protein
MKHDLMIDFMFCILSTIGFVVGLWMIDISNSGLLLYRNVVNIWGVDVDPNISYHAGFIVSTSCFIMIIGYLFLTRIQTFMHKKN